MWSESAYGAAADIAMGLHEGAVDPAGDDTAQADLPLANTSRRRDAKQISTSNWTRQDAAQSVPSQSYSRRYWRVVCQPRLRVRRAPVCHVLYMTALSRDPNLLHAPGAPGQTQERRPGRRHA